jgi:hypothetical protein
MFEARQQINGPPVTRLRLLASIRAGEPCAVARGIQGIARTGGRPVTRRRSRSPAQAELRPETVHSGLPPPVMSDVRADHAVVRPRRGREPARRAGGPGRATRAGPRSPTSAAKSWGGGDVPSVCSVFRWSSRRQPCPELNGTTPLDCGSPRRPVQGSDPVPGRSIDAFRKTPPRPDTVGGLHRRQCPRCIASYGRPDSSLVC